MPVSCLLLLGCLIPSVADGATPSEKEMEALLGREIIGPRRTLLEVQDYTEAKVPRMPAVSSASEWDAYAQRLRRDVLDRVVYRGEARTWRDAKTKVEWLGMIPGGPGYHIKKL